MHIRLEAIHAEKNIYRRYEIMLKKGLFNRYIVHLVYGCIGQEGGTEIITSFDTKKEADAYAKRIVKGRLSDQSRIGVNYQII